ncbi:polysaccharide deacetylase [Planococcus kocurii]|uniref:Polysaccharide deacetylase n=1 Tax=Planococcus kocurii TaxID=1374 RepID=A0ABM5WV19_9BACL|nr:polysaccharide deacetylase family protein [Planococcus kocurii]ALS78152.1 polysaccharide deacetylase [Planococcus kocurii]
MINRKAMVLVTALLLLAACGNDDEAVTNKEEKTVKEQVATEGKKAEKDEEVIETKEEAVEEEPKEEVTSEPQYRINPANWSVQPIADAAEKVVLVTIDDAPDKHSIEMAETLKSKEIPAIFFVNGHFLDTDEEKQQLKEIYDMGFVIGNHTYSHENLKTLSEQQQQQEILEINKVVEEITGEKPKFFRAPFGSNTDFSKQLVEDQQMVLMNWTYGYDWEKDYQDAAALTEIMVNTEYLNNGANLLMHDRDWTAEALPGIIRGLQDKGYGFVDPKTIEGM